jgi:hypothetical protein
VRSPLPEGSDCTVCSPVDNERVIKQRDVGLLRLVAQRIAGPGATTAADAVRWMTATQAQDYPSAVLAIALRTQSRSRAEVHAALDSGSVVRSWPMRGTLHFVAAEDLSWMLALTAERSLATSQRYRAQLGLELSTVERARDVAIETLSGGGRTSRADLLASWEKAGLQNVKEHGYRLIWDLAQMRTLCLGPTGLGPTGLGPTKGREQHFVLFDEWITTSRHLERDEALGEWALRYFRSHGPATVKDFTWWTQLKAADVKTAVAIAAPELERIVVDDRTARSTSAKGARRLPASCLRRVPLGLPNEDRGVADGVRRADSPRQQRNLPSNGHFGRRGGRYVETGWNRCEPCPCCICLHNFRRTG